MERVDEAVPGDAEQCFTRGGVERMGGVGSGAYIVAGGVRDRAGPGSWMTPARSAGSEPMIESVAGAMASPSPKPNNAKPITMGR
ncbi:MAG: hypothetical protein ACKV2O_10170 [Acidimicrobiales bacterium]